MKLPDGDFHLVKRVVVLSGREFNDGMLRRHGLHHRRPRLLAAARPADHLRDQAERRLRRAVIAHVQAHIRVQNADERHIFKIEPLGHHLRPKQDRNFFLLEAPEQLLMAVAGRHRVRVHAQELRVREHPVELLLDLLRPASDGL